MKSNKLLQMYQMNKSMKSLQDNQILNGTGNRQQPQQKIDPSKIKERILDQRHTDPKMAPNVMTKMYDMMKQKLPEERKKLWETRTDQPYKNILPPSEVKKKYEKAEDLIVYRVSPSDRNKEELSKKCDELKDKIYGQNEELKKIYSNEKKEEHTKEFEYNHITKYGVKYDPSEFNEMKDDVINYYKKEQQESEKEKKCVHDIYDEMGDEFVDGKTRDDIVEVDSVIPKNNSSKDEGHNQKNDILDKYAQRQKKV